MRSLSLYQDAYRWRSIDQKSLHQPWGEGGERHYVTTSRSRTLACRMLTECCFGLDLTNAKNAARECLSNVFECLELNARGARRYHHSSSVLYHVPDATTTASRVRGLCGHCISMQHSI
eukprot:scaffold124159_cov27-Tisochrysis_lutea.AAC.1